MSDKIIVKYDSKKVEVEMTEDFLSDNKEIIVKGSDLIACDGYHTFEELYDHRITLFITLCRICANDITEYKFIYVWRSKLHSDGSSFEGWFVLGIGKEKGEQITYHLPLDRWEETNFAETLEKAPEYDGHTSGDVLERLKNL